MAEVGRSVLVTVAYVDVFELPTTNIDLGSIPIHGIEINFIKSEADPKIFHWAFAEDIVFCYGFYSFSCSQPPSVILK